MNTVNHSVASQSVMLFASNETSPGTHAERETPERYKDAVWTVQDIAMQSVPSLIDGALMGLHIRECVQCVL